MKSRRLDGRRVLVALIFTPLFYLLVRYGPPFAFFALVTTAAMLALAEFYKLYFREQGVPNTGMVLGLGAVIVLLVSMQWPSIMPEHAAFLVILVTLLLYRAYSRRGFTKSLVESAVLIFGPLYIGLTLGHLLLTRSLTDGAFLIFFVFLVTWASDTGAYYVGTSLGRRKLSPVMSPNKTVEGLVGGVLLGLISALVARAWFLPSFTVADCVITGLLLPMAGLVGDLAESALKRSAGVKDSGWVLPGHGGMLDRIDSLLLTAPTFYYYVFLVKGLSA